MHAATQQARTATHPRAPQGLGFSWLCPRAHSRLRRAHAHLGPTMCNCGPLLGQQTTIQQHMKYGQTHLNKPQPRQSTSDGTWGKVSLAFCLREVYFPKHYPHTPQTLTAWACKALKVKHSAVQPCLPRQPSHRYTAAPCQNPTATSPATDFTLASMSHSSLAFAAQVARGPSRAEHPAPSQPPFTVPNQLSTEHREDLGRARLGGRASGPLCKHLDVEHRWCVEHVACAGSCPPACLHAQPASPPTPPSHAAPLQSASSLPARSCQQVRCWPAVKRASSEGLGLGAP
jgi:hypothetical protein